MVGQDELRAEVSRRLLSLLLQLFTLQLVGSDLSDHPGEEGAYMMMHSKGSSSQASRGIDLRLSSHCHLPHKMCMVLCRWLTDKITY